VGKLNYRINDRKSGYVRYARFTNHQPNNAGGLTIPDRGVNFDDHMNGGGAQLATAFSPSLLNELRYGAIQRTQANAHQIIDNVTWTRGRHTWKLGIDYQHTNFDIFKPENVAYAFGGLSAAGSARGAVSALNQYLYTVQGLTDPATGKASAGAGPGGDRDLRRAVVFGGAPHARDRDPHGAGGALRVGGLDGGPRIAPAGRRGNRHRRRRCGGPGQPGHGAAVRRDGNRSCHLRPHGNRAGLRRGRRRPGARMACVDTGSRGNAAERIAG
jgi:hypothetical protein